MSCRTGGSPNNQESEVRAVTIGSLSMDTVCEIRKKRIGLHRVKSVDVLGFVMAGGRGSRLKVLTRDICKPAVNIFGRYRIFDFVASNIANTGIPVVLIATQFQPESLYRYIGDGRDWDFDGVRRILEIVNSHDEGENAEFEGTADCVRKSIHRINRYDPEIVLVLGADHVYCMDYRDVINHHKMNNADITIMTDVVSESKVGDLGIVKIDASSRITDFAEKPTNKELIEEFRLTDSMKARLSIHDPNLSFLNCSGVDFGRDIIPAIKEDRGNLYAYVFNGYWRDVGRVQDYLDCNMEFAEGKQPIDLLKHAMKTHEGHWPPARIVSHSSIQRSILSPGDIVQSGSIVKSCVLGRWVVVEEGCKLDHCVFLGADGNGIYSAQARKRTCSTSVGRGSSLSYVILDEGVRIGEGVDVGPHNGSPERRKRILGSIGLILLCHLRT